MSYKPIVTKEMINKHILHILERHALEMPSDSTCLLLLTLWAQWELLQQHNDVGRISEMRRQELERILMSMGNSQPGCYLAYTDLGKTKLTWLASQDVFVQGPRIEQRGSEDVARNLEPEL